MEHDSYEIYTLRPGREPVYVELDEDTVRDIRSASQLMQILKHDGWEGGIDMELAGEIVVLVKHHSISIGYHSHDGFMTGVYEDELDESVVFDSTLLYYLEEDHLGYTVEEFIDEFVHKRHYDEFVRQLGQHTEGLVDEAERYIDSI